MLKSMKMLSIDPDMNFYKCLKSVCKVLTDIQSSGSCYAIYLVNGVPRHINEVESLISGYFCLTDKSFRWFLDFSLWHQNQLDIMSGISTSVYPVSFSSFSFIAPTKGGKKPNFPFPHNKAFPNFVLLCIKSIQIICEATLKQGENMPQR